MNRPSWTDYFLGLAKVVSQRSHDIHTQHGCIITDSNNRILGMGYNGFPKGLDDTNLPTSRPEKYHWLVHSERNALANCVIRPDNGIAYVTGQCCNDCIIALWQEGIRTVIMSNNHGTKLFDEEAKKRFNTFVEMSRINIQYVDPDLSWLKQLCGVL
ncbi:MAG: cytidine deaminase [Chitinophagia bacterium]|nr:cytidine deaminase [Chitinophagia bacterium]